MAPPSSSTAAARRPASSRPARESGRTSARRPPLRVVTPRRSDGARRRLVTLLPIAMVIGALLIVVVGQAMLASGQVRMSGIDQQLATAQDVHRSIELQVTGLETPQRIVSMALKDGMVHPNPAVTQLPYVSLTTPLATPTVTPAPGAPATSSTQTPAQ